MSAEDPSTPDGLGRIAVLSPELADQIAAGEVVERPASVVKELVENALDAGATRVEVEVEGAGLERIVVVDDGSGIHPDDLQLCITRHATSKVRRPTDLIDVATLGFRGEALASIAAVADVVIDSRMRGARMGRRLLSRPGLEPTVEPVGMPQGTRIEVSRLFAHVPARKKFMRSPATEVGQCSETILRLSLVHPEVHLRLRSDGRVLVDLAAVERGERIRQVLGRRSAAAPESLQGAAEGVRVEAWMCPPHAAVRHRNGIFVVVRRRVVRDRTLQQILVAAYGDTLAPGTHPVACLVVEPPRGEVDVNVHPQKSEIRFSDPQRVYRVLRDVLEPVAARFARTQAPHTSPEIVMPMLDPLSSSRSGAVEVGRGGPGYTLRTRATAGDYATMRTELHRQAHEIREAWRDDLRDEPVTSREEDSEPAGPSLELLTCLPGPVAILRDGDHLYAVDVRALRSHLVYRRLLEDVGGGSVQSQTLLQPVVVRRAPHEMRLWEGADEALGPLGLMIEPFGDDAVVVRGVPAHLRSCVEEPDVADLVERVAAWLRMDAGGSKLDREAALRAMAQTRGNDPAPRLARRWLRELLEAGEEPQAIPGVVRWTAADLLRGPSGRATTSRSPGGEGAGR